MIQPTRAGAREVERGPSTQWGGVGGADTFDKKSVFRISVLVGYLITVLCFKVVQQGSIKPTTDAREKLGFGPMTSDWANSSCMVVEGRP